MQTRQGIQGIDISHYQGTIDFQAVKSAGIQFIYAKATEGATYQDPMFACYVAGAKNAGIPIGAYHFARPNQTSAQDEAANYLNQIKANPVDLYPVLDLEAPTQTTMDKTTLIQWVHDFVNIISSATGKPVIVYTGKWFADRYNDFDNSLASQPLWISQYADDVPDFGGWTQWTMWQYSDTGNVPGIQGPVDLDVAVSLEAIGYHPPVKTYPLAVEDANVLMEVLKGFYNFKLDDPAKLEIHRLANELRKASGQPTQE